MPGWGEQRIAGMIAGRPDWCISRQRTWGVPIRALRRQGDRRAASAHAELIEESPQRVEKDGIDAWFALDPAELLGADADAVRQGHRRDGRLGRFGRVHSLRGDSAAGDARRRSICISKARISTAAGSTARCSCPRRCMGARRIAAC